MRALLAIASVTIAEARQDRVTLVFLVLALVLIPFTAFLPSLDHTETTTDVTAAAIGGDQLVTQNRNELGGLAQSGARENVLRKFSLVVSLFFGGLTAVFLAAKSIPRDFETRLVLTIVSKPVRRWQYYLGKLAGIGVVILVTLALHGLISIALLYGACDAARLRPVGRIYPDSVQITGASEILEESVKGEPLQYLMGDAEGGLRTGAPVRAIFSFSGLKRDALGDAVVVESNLALAATAMRTRVDVALRWRAIDSESGAPQVIERKSRPGSRTLIALTPASVTATGQLDVIVDRMDNDFVIGVSTNRLWIRDAPASFLWTFTKMQLLVALQLLVIAAAVLSVSTFTAELTGIMAGVLLLGAANLVGFVQYTLARAAEREDAARQRAAAIAVRDAAGAADTNERRDAAVRNVRDGRTTRERLMAICAIVPDFDRYDLARFYEEGYEIPPALVWPLVLYNLGYIVVFAIPGLILLRLREIAA
jgi:hypothetical protein